MMSRSLSRISLASLAFALGAAALPGQAAPGFRLFGTLFSSDTYLMDANGVIVHTWPSALEVGVATYLSSDGSLLRTIKTGDLPEGAGGTGGGLQRIAMDGTVTWDFRYNSGGKTSHHDFVELPNGNIIMVAWEDKTPAEAIEAGRNPALIPGNYFRPDHLIEVQPNGPTGGIIVWEWHLWDHLIQDFNPARANYGVVGDHPELLDINFPPIASIASDWNHMNAVRYDPVHDWLVMSCPRQNEIYIIDHSTSTAEAASHSGGNYGRGGDILYRWGNPQAYRAGTAADQRLYFQHAPWFIPTGYPGAGHLLVFNNQAPGGSQVLELELPLDPTGNFVRAPGTAFGPMAPVWSYAAPGFNSPLVSSAERLPNGNTLICSGSQGRVFEIDPAGQVVWNYQISAPIPTSIFHAHYVERTLWTDSRTISATDGASVLLRYIGGTPLAFGTEVLAGSASGTFPGFPVGGIHVPLNWDAWTDFTLSYANSPLLSHSIGVTGIYGDGTSVLNVPPGALPVSIAGAHFDFAALLVGYGTTQPLAASNPVRLTIVP